MPDQLIPCRHCGKNFCYENINEGISISWRCIFCGFESSTHMMNSTLELQAYLDSPAVPALYKDLGVFDEDEFFWVPQYVRTEGVGEIYATPLGGEEWCWTFAPHIPILESEKEMYINPDGSYRKYKADMSRAKRFDKDAFSGALMAGGFL